MNIFQKVTLETLKKNRTRTIVTIIGIILSAAMICAVTTFAQSFKNYLYENEKASGGDWYGMADETSKEKIEELKKDEELEQISRLQILGYAQVKSENEEKPYLYITGMDENFEKSMPVNLVSGRLPKNTSEIILPIHLTSNGGLKYNIGDAVKLELGKRMLDGQSLGQNTPYFSQEESGFQEEFQKQSIRTFTVTGYYERPDFESYTAPGYTALTVSDDTLENATYTVYFKTKDAKSVYNFMEKHALTGDTNTSLLMYLGVSIYDGFYTVLYGLAGIVIFLIMLGSVSLIYNAFSISVSERTKQFGLLSSIGATKKQLRHSVLFEALVISGIGIPIGIVSGIGGIGITIMLLADKIQRFADSPVKMTVSVSWWSVLAAVIIALITVLISAWIPSRRAMKITTIEAIRQSQDIRVAAKDVKSSKLVYKIFGLEGMLAQKYFRRNRKKYRATVASLFMSIVLFISASSFCSYLMDSIKGTYNTTSYDIAYYFDSKLEDVEQKKIADALKKAEGVKSSCIMQRYWSDSTVDVKEVTEYIREKYQVEGVYQNYVDLYFVENKVYEDFLKENKLDTDAFLDRKNPIPIIYNTFTEFDMQEEKYVTYSALNHPETEIQLVQYQDYDGYYNMGISGDDVIYVNDMGEEMRVPKSEAMKVNIVNTKGSVFIDKLPDNVLAASNNVILLYPETALKTFDFINHNPAREIYFTVDNHEAVCEEMSKILTENGLSNNNLVDYAARAEDNRNMVFVFNIFAYGFIVLISFIAVANVFNTISTNVALRRREFAMLKSVGMTPKGFNKMMSFECILYGVKALILGIPVSIAVTWVIYRVVSEGYMTAFYIPVHALIIAVLSVFIVVFATMMYAMSKIKKENPIDALKNENI